MNPFPFDTYNLLISFIVIFAIQIIFFAFASTFKTDKITDFAYGLTFVVIAWLTLALHGALRSTHVLLVVMITLWGFRLATYLFIRILKIKKDERFNGIREDFFKFATFWFFQAALIFIISIPVILYLSSPEPVNGFFGILGLCIWIVGLLIETIADQQKFMFRNDTKNDNKWVDTGLWHFSRHPNYFGEILCWIGVFIFTVEALHGWMWIALLSPVTIYLTIRYFSGVPLLEKKDDEKYGENPYYAKYKLHTNMLILGPKKK